MWTKRVAAQLQLSVMRDDSSPPQSILATSSLSGFSALEELASGYLAASKKRGQPLCGNSEGWGPLSPIRYDFTPCFMDVWVSSVAVFGILGGACAVWWLLNKKKAQEVSRDWHFWTKQVWSPPFFFAILNGNKDLSINEAINCLVQSCHLLVGFYSVFANLLTILCRLLSLP